MSPDIWNIWLPLIVAALVHASFALGVSMLTLLSGRVLSQPKSERRLSILSSAYIFGAFLTILSSVIGATYILSNISFSSSEQFWSVLSGVATGVGLVVLLFYYRWGKSGTRLWLPRRAAEFLYRRISATKYSFEAFILGVGSVVAELIFIAAPILVAASIIVNLCGTKQILAILIYVVIAILPLIILCISNYRGKQLSAFQKWRENNKKFLQIAAGVLLIMLGIYLFVYKGIGG